MFCFPICNGIHYNLFVCVFQYKEMHIFFHVTDNKSLLLFAGPVTVIPVLISNLHRIHIKYKCVLAFSTGVKYSATFSAVPLTEFSTLCIIKSS